MYIKFVSIFFYHLSVYLCVCICVYECVFVYMPICFICVSVWLSICLSVYPRSVCLPVCVSLSICLSACLYFFFFFYLFFSFCSPSPVASIAASSINTPLFTHTSVPSGAASPLLCRHTGISPPRCRRRRRLQVISALSTTQYRAGDVQIELSKALTWWLEREGAGGGERAGASWCLGREGEACPGTGPRWWRARWRLFHKSLSLSIITSSSLTSVKMETVKTLMMYRQGDRQRHTDRQTDNK